MQTDNKCKSCESSDCSAKAQQPNESKEEFIERQALQKRLCGIKHKILVLSGKGGVGKSTVAANLAIALSSNGNQVGVLDADIHGPSMPKMLGIEESGIEQMEEAIIPARANDNLKVMSIGLLLRNRDDALIWRGPMKMGVIKQFLKDVEWGALDYLIIDLPPGTGDEPLSICQLITDADGAVIVTTPQEVALIDVRKSINFCHKLELPVIGVIENMSGFTCPHCSKTTDIFTRGGAEKMCSEMKVPFLGRLPLDPEMVSISDSGRSLSQLGSERESNQAFKNIVTSIIKNN